MNRLEDCLQAMDLALLVEVRLAPEVDLSAQAMATVRQRLQELLDDLGLPLTPAVTAAPAGAALVHPGFELMIDGQRARMPMLPPPPQVAERWDWQIAEALFHNRCLLVTEALVAHLHQQLPAAAELSVGVLGQMLRRGAQLGLSLEASWRVLLSWGQFGGGLGDDGYGLEALWAAEMSTQVRVEISRELYDVLYAPAAVAMAEEQPEKSVDGLVALMRDGLFYELGLMFPAVTFELVETLPALTYRAGLNQVRGPLQQGLALEAVLVNETVAGLSLLDVEGQAALHPMNRRLCAIAPAAALPKIESAGLVNWDTTGAMILTLAAQLRRQAAEYCSLAQVETILRNLDQIYPMLVFNTLERFSLHTLAQVLQNLLREEVSIRDLPKILEGLLGMDSAVQGRYANQILISTLQAQVYTYSEPQAEPSAQDLSEACRTSLRSQITYQLTRGGPTLTAWLLDPALEQRLQEVPQQRLDALERAALLQALHREVTAYPEGTDWPVLLVEKRVRWRLWDAIALEFPGLKVLSYDELTPTLTIQPLKRIGWELSASAAAASQAAAQ